MKSVYNDESRQEITQVARSALEEGKIEGGNKSSVVFAAIANHLKSKITENSIQAELSFENIDQFEERLHRENGLKDQLKRLVQECKQ